MPNIATITNNVISALSGTTSQVLLGDATLTDFKLDSLTDVNVPTPGDGDVLRWNATTSLWEASDAAGTTGSGTTNYIPLWQDANTLTNSAIYQDANSHVVIGGTTVAGSTFTVYAQALRTGGIGVRNSAGTYAGFFGNYAAGSGGGSTDMLVDSAGFIAFSTAASERVRITSTGNVGIGTTAPTAKLHIIGDGRFGSYMYLGSEGAGGVIGDLSTANYLRFLVSNAEAIRIISSGNIGIGNTSPQSQLQVGAKLGTGLNVYSFTGYKFGVENGTSRFIGPEITASNQSTVIADFVLGASAAWQNPTGLITFTGRDRGNNVDSGVLGYVGVTKTTAANSVGSGNLIFGTSAASSLTSTEHMRITSVGDVGIGTTAPQYKLDVRGSVNVRSSIPSIFFDRNGSYTWRLSNGDGTLFPLSTFNIANNANTAVATFLDNGNVGIGTTTPNYLLHLQTASTFLTHNLKVNAVAAAGNYAEIAFQLWSGATGGQNVFGGTGTSRPSVVLRALSEDSNANGALVFGTFGAGATNATLTEKMRLTSTGNLGINTTAPDEKLVIQGNGARIKIQTAGNPTTYYTTIESNYDAGNTFNIIDNGTYKFGSKALVTYNDTYINGYYNVYIATGTTTNNNAANIRMFVNQIGDVGVGTTSPNPYSWAARTFTVSSSVTNSYAALEAYGNGTGAGALLLGNNTVLRASIVGVDGSHLSFATNGNNTGSSQFERMRITSAGDVGIGVTAPNVKLDVNGTLDLRNAFQGYARLAPSAGNGSQARLTVRLKPVDTAEVVMMSLVQDGSVGIGGNITDIISMAGAHLRFTSAGAATFVGGVDLGTNNVLAKLNVSGHIYAVNGTGASGGSNIYLGSVDFNNASYWNSAPGIGAVYSATSAVASDLAFYTYAGVPNSRTERARFFYSGNLAIGSTSDTGERLQVTGNVKITGIATFSSTYGFSIGSIAGSKRIQYGSDSATAFSLLTDINTYAGLYSGTILSSLTSGSIILRELGNNPANNAIEVHIRPSAGKSGYLTFTENAVADRWALGIANGNGNLRFIAGTALGTEVMSLSSAGVLTITGDATINGVRIGKGPNSLTGNTVFGASALNGVTTGTNNVAIGSNALDGTTTGSNNIAIGFSAGGIGAAENTTGSQNIFIGAEVQGESATDSNRTWIGGPTTTSTWLAGNLLLGTKTNSTYRLDVVGATRLSSTLLVGGATTLTNLAGTGTRIVVADTNGILSTQPTSTYLSSLSGEATNDGSVVTLTNSAVIGKVLTGLNVSSSIITASDSILTAFGKIQGQIDALQGGTVYKGSWNASTNTPTITSSVGTQGNYYVVTTAGTTNINGISSWSVGDWIIFNGTVWEKIPNSNDITSVNGQTGVVVLTTSNINEGTNLYYTDTRSRDAISLTVSGNSGAATYTPSTGVFNIPTYTLGGLGGVATGTTITINGVAQDLSTNRTYNVGTITSIVAGSYLTGGTITSSGTIAVDATTTNTANKIVARDASGNFSAGTITATLSGISTNSYSLYYEDGPRDLSNRLPNSFTRTVLYDFVTSGVVGGTGAYGGVMTYVPWTGTTASTGDSSYQLAFMNLTGSNGTGLPGLRIRKGIDSTWGTWYTLLHAGNYNSYAPSLTGTGASGDWGINITGNAVTVGGLSIHSARNNEANKVVRTDGSGYIQAGWINTLSGDNGTTPIDRIYASSDAYIRYYTPANFRQVLDVPTRTGSGASGNWGINITGNAASASTSSQVTINYNNNSDAAYQMLWGSGNSVYGTSGIICNPFTDSINMSGTLFSGGITVNGFGRMYGGDFWHSGTANNGTRTITLRLGRFSDSEIPSYSIYTDDTNGDILEFYSERFTGDFRLTRNSETGLRNMMRVASDNGGSFIDLYDGGGSSVNSRITTNGNSYLMGGNVGIGINTPAYKLDVSGDVRISGELIMSDTDVVVTEADQAARFSKTYSSASNLTNLNLYSTVSNVLFNLTSASYNGDESFNATSLLSQTTIVGNSGSVSTQPMRAIMAGIVGQSGSAAMNIADFRYIDIKQPDRAGITGHVIQNIYGLKVADMKNSTGYTITNSWAIYQEGANDNNYFNGKVVLGSNSVGVSKLRLVGLPTSSAGLSSGDVWNSGGTLRIV